MDDKQPVRMFYELNCSKIFLFGFGLNVLKKGIKNRNSALNRVGKSAIFVLNRVRVRGAGPHLPTQGYIEYPPPSGCPVSFSIGLEIACRAVEVGGNIFKTPARV